MQGAGRGERLGGRADRQPPSRHGPAGPTATLPRPAAPADVAPVCPAPQGYRVPHAALASPWRSASWRGRSGEAPGEGSLQRGAHLGGRAGPARRGRPSRAAVGPRPHPGRGVELTGLSPPPAFAPQPGPAGDPELAPPARLPSLLPQQTQARGLQRGEAPGGGSGPGTTAAATARWCFETRASCGKRSSSPGRPPTACALERPPPGGDRAEPTGRRPRRRAGRPGGEEGLLAR